MKYKKIIVDSLINRYLKIFGTICIEGPKWCGKTWTSSHHAKSEFLVEDPNGNFSNWLFVEIEPYTILEGESPRLIGAVTELDDGNWCAFEIKLWLSKAEEENNLIKVCDDIVANGGRVPLIKCVIYGVGNIAYQNDKGIGYIYFTYNSIGRLKNIYSVNN